MFSKTRNNTWILDLPIPKHFHFLQSSCYLVPSLCIFIFGGGWISLNVLMVNSYCLKLMSSLFLLWEASHALFFQKQSWSSFLLHHQVAPFQHFPNPVSFDSPNICPTLEPISNYWAEKVFHLCFSNTQQEPSTW